MGNRQDDFQARLERIQAASRARFDEEYGVAQNPVVSGRRPEPLPSRAPRRRGFGVFGVLSFMFVILLLIGGAGTYVIADRAISRASEGENLAGMSLTELVLEEARGLLDGGFSGVLNGEAAFFSQSQRETGPPQRPWPDAASLRVQTDQGTILKSPAVATRDNRDIRAIELARGFVRTTPAHEPGNVIPFEFNTECTLRSPRAGENVVNVRLASAGMETQLQAFSKAALADVLGDRLKSVTRKQREYNADTEIKGEVRAVDVFITDTSAPQYVIFQTIGPGVIWNVHLADGVTLAHVAMIGAEASGFAGAQEKTTFEALRVGDFVGGHSFGADDRDRECMIRPWREPQAHWGNVKKAVKNNLLYENQVHSYTTGHAAYDRWMTSAIGYSADHNLITAKEASHILIGPMPETRLTYESLQSRDIVMSAYDYLFFGPADARAAATTRIHDEVINAAIGGDPDQILGPVMEVLSQ
ncbi:hypothetical protein [Litoreibacter roseus]|uniref:Uncharacterized protein n=1 Tax=Litoreibacter roseus TaxID=2601869 RepID=A0A6N6JEN1_9RHOB|nr:hypothetical protein [Litoreibacter roseus]GFE63672.1 hypothetical protein KIN_07460 [Litoreibacter roseus]